MTRFQDVVAALTARGPGRMIPDLDRIRALADLLGDPQLTYPSIHVTGTNGKGSVAAMTSRLLHELGLGVGTYTSPHLQTVRERLRAYELMIPEDVFADVYDEVEQLTRLVDDQLEHPDDHVTYFELLTAMAFAWFGEVPVDVGVFEVGMGGQWDATNLIRGEVAVFGPIDLDHRELGATAVEVAAEKAGIIKPGAHVVTAEQRDDVTALLARVAEEHGSSLARFDEEFGIDDHRVAVGGQRIGFRIGDRIIPEIFLPLLGDHQAENAALALAAVAAFLGESFDEVGPDVVEQAFADVAVPGRLEIVHREPTVVIDGAHNPHGARAAVRAVESYLGPRSTILLIGVLDDKDVEGVLREYAAAAEHVVVAPAPSARAATVERLVEIAERIWSGSGVAVESAHDIETALELATGVAGPGDLVLATGSLYLAGAVRDVYLPIPPPE